MILAKRRHRNRKPPENPQHWEVAKQQHARQQQKQRFVILLVKKTTSQNLETKLFTLDANSTCPSEDHWGYLDITS